MHFSGCLRSNLYEVTRHPCWGWLSGIKVNRHLGQTKSPLTNHYFRRIRPVKGHLKYQKVFSRPCVFSANLNRSTSLYFKSSLNLVTHTRKILIKTVIRRENNTARYGEFYSENRRQTRGHPLDFWVVFLVIRRCKSGAEIFILKLLHTYTHT